MDFPATTPRPPYYAVVFSLRRTPVDDAGYAVMAERMLELAAQQPGYLGVESAHDADGQGITVSYWTSLDAIREWGRHVEHRVAQAAGKAKWYETFRLRICRVEEEGLSSAIRTSQESPMSRPESTEYAGYFGNYVALVPEENILPVMAAQMTEALALLREVPEAQGIERHPPYTWSVKEVVGHVTDAERVFSYRALRFARADQTPLPGFDENPYVTAAEFDRVPLKDLVSEFENLRRSNLCLFGNLTDEAWLRTGEASGKTLSVRALAYILVGHARHHFTILQKRLAQRRELA